MGFGSYGMKYGDASSFRSTAFDALVTNFCQPLEGEILYSSKVCENLSLEIEGQHSELPPLIPEKPIDFLNYTRKLQGQLQIYFSCCLAETIRMECTSTSYKRHFNTLTNHPLAKKLLVGLDFKPQADKYIGRVNVDQNQLLQADNLY
mmetsp:Transcript_6897/g.11109  ORF Transcript_6897/g.11109 Transcript_6897/m.11109 type:complete len:148 (+) Transcript_6897:188-631(+)